jgi:hypothetical protein
MSDDSAASGRIDPRDDRAVQLSFPRKGDASWRCQDDPADSARQPITLSPSDRARLDLAVKQDDPYTTFAVAPWSKWTARTGNLPD